MRREVYSSTNLGVYRWLANFCIFLLFGASLGFMVLFFYQDLKNVIKQETRAMIKTEEEKSVVPVMEFEPVSLGVLEPKKEIIIESEQLSTDEQKKAQKIFISYDLGNYALTSRLITDFLGDYPDSEFRDRVLITGVKLMRTRKDYHKALEYIQKILSNASISAQDYSETVLLLGSISREQHRYDSYIQNYLEQAYFKAAEPIKSQLAFYLGYLLLYKKDFTASLGYFNNVIGEDGVLGRADYYMVQGMIPEAVAALESFMDLYPNSQNYDYVKNAFMKQIKLHAENLVVKGYIDSAMRFYAKIAKRFPNTYDADFAWMNISDLYYQKGSKKMALEALLKILNNDDKLLDDEALFKMGTIAFELEDSKKALLYFRMLTEQFPESSKIQKAREWQNLIIESLTN